MISDSLESLQITRWSDGKIELKEDQLIVEAPLQISLRYGPKDQRQTFTLAITMRTPGDDHHLIYGFLFCEQIIQKLEDIVQVREISENHVVVELRSYVPVVQAELQRNVLATSSCGACGKTNLEQLQLHIPWIHNKKEPRVSAAKIGQCISALNRHQPLFECTGGNHGVAFFENCKLVFLAEDVGRHNAMDKAIGRALQEQKIPLSDHLVLVSGRASFELVQKALMAGIPIMAAVGAPSSLAMEMAADHDMTLIGFLRQDQFNIYSGAGRILT